MYAKIDTIQIAIHYRSIAIAKEMKKKKLYIFNWQEPTDTKQQQQL